MTDQVFQIRTVVACSEFVIVRSKNASSASLNNNSVTEHKSLSAKPNLLHRFRNESSRTRPAAEQVPDQARAHMHDFRDDCSTEHILQRLERLNDGMP